MWKRLISHLIVAATVFVFVGLYTNKVERIPDNAKIVVFPDKALWLPDNFQFTMDNANALINSSYEHMAADSALDKGMKVEGESDLTSVYAKIDSRYLYLSRQEKAVYLDVKPGGKYAGFRTPKVSLHPLDRGDEIGLVTPLLVQQSPDKTRWTSEGYWRW